MRLAAVGDLHVGADSAEHVAAGLEHVAGHADVLLLAGDLTRCGEPDEASLLAKILAEVELPIVAVLGNHDHHADRVDEVVGVLQDAGVTVLEGEAVTLQVDGAWLGVAGTKGFGGGFTGRRPASSARHR
jgi:Icc-related predicted phosphoesterase